MVVPIAVGTVACTSGDEVGTSAGTDGPASEEEVEATEEDLMATVFAHPTMSEAMHEAVLDSFGKVLHL